MPDTTGRGETGDGRRVRCENPRDISSGEKSIPRVLRLPSPVSRLPSPVSRLPSPVSRLVPQRHRRIDRRRAARGNPARHDTDQRDEPDDGDVRPRVGRAHTEQERLQEV